MTNEWDLQRTQIVPASNISHIKISSIASICGISDVWYDCCLNILGGWSKVFFSKSKGFLHDFFAVSCSVSALGRLSPSFLIWDDILLTCIENICAVPDALNFKGLEIFSVRHVTVLTMLIEETLTKTLCEVTEYVHLKVNQNVAHTKVVQCSKC